MNLKPQTVYIPNDKNPTGVYHSTQSSVPVRKYTDQICLSKEELISLFDQFLEFARDQNNGNMILHGFEKQQFINNLFNQ